MREAGEFLVELKKRLRHGEFTRAVRKCGYEGTHYQKLMQFAKGAEKLNLSVDQVKGATLSTMTKAVRNGKNALAEESIDRRVSSFTASGGARATHGVHHGDSLGWLKAIESGSVGFVIADPPYGIGKTYGAGTADEWSEARNHHDHSRWIQPYYVEMCRVLKPGGQLVMWQSATYFAHLREMFAGCVVDVQPVKVRGFNTYETLVRWTKPGGERHSMIPATMGAVLPASYGFHDRPFFVKHGCAKDAKAVKAVLEFYTTAGSVVADPFCGTGTTLVEAKKLGRVPMGCELVFDHVEQARTRLAEVA